MPPPSADLAKPFIISLNPILVEVRISDGGVTEEGEGAAKKATGAAAAKAEAGDDDDEIDLDDDEGGEAEARKPREDGGEGGPNPAGADEDEDEINNPPKFSSSFPAAKDDDAKKPLRRSGCTSDRRAARTTRVGRAGPLRGTRTERSFRDCVGVVRPPRGGRFVKS